MTRFLLVCLGGAAGSGARYLVGLALARPEPAAFPVATLVVNVAGSFAMGALAEVAAARAMNETLRVTLAAGVLGGFTTYSAFNQETLRLAALASPWTAAVNVGVTVVACLLAGAGGMAAARAFAG